MPRSRRTLHERLWYLQAVTNALNLQNQSGAYRNSLTGVRGVQFNKDRNAYRVRVAVDGTRYHGGSFGTLDEAEEAAIALRNSLMTNNLLDRSAVAVGKASTAERRPTPSQQGEL